MEKETKTAGSKITQWVIYKFKLLLQHSSWRTYIRIFLVSNDLITPIFTCILAVLSFCTKTNVKLAQKIWSSWVFFRLVLSRSFFSTFMVVKELNYLGILKNFLMALFYTILCFEIAGLLFLLFLFLVQFPIEFDNLSLQKYFVMDWRVEFCPSG